MKEQQKKEVTEQIKSIANYVAILYQNTLNYGRGRTLKTTRQPQLIIHIIMTDLELKKSLLSCPGDSIQEHIDHIGMSQAELAERLGRSVPKLNELIKGKAPISKETATKLEYVLGVPASFWLNLERNYEDELLEISQMEHLQQCQEWVAHVN